ncbi:hypothetical protein Enr13x_04790 [Stieleria neptunia]|uniref:Uncharacterized protein n=1 Tax=Stieleria neptunia TaxID=2527979 RepID=A0A518HIF7_9BACT|nr:hypothetical protein Enr13x_04790 [Stieleria neptunia]
MNGVAGEPESGFRPPLFQFHSQTCSIQRRRESSVMTRISLAYPKIPGSSKAPFRRCVAFEKYDGTNLHWVWDWELQWHAFGTRRDRFDLDTSGVDAFNAAHVGLEEAADIFRESLARQFLAKYVSDSDLLNMVPLHSRRQRFPSRRRDRLS